MTHQNLPYLKHILDAINDIEHSVRGLTKKEFKEHKDIKDAQLVEYDLVSNSQGW